MFSQSDVERAIFDCEKQLQGCRLRLSAVNTSKGTAPRSAEDDAVILRKKVRMKGFEEDVSVISELQSEAESSLAGGNVRMGGRRASLSSEQHEKIKDRIIRTFNLDEKRGLTMMRENGFGRTPQQTAKFLLTTGGLNREMVGRALGSFYDDRGMESLRLFAEGVNMQGMQFMEALRVFLKKFKLPGESQMVDRILEAFAKAYCKANPQDFSVDSAHAIAFAVIILNTDAHSHNLKQLAKMTKLQFTHNTRDIEGCKELSTEFLESIYDEVTANEIVHQENKHDEGNLFHDAVKEGWMRKKAAGAAAIAWRKRFFILTKNPPQLYYFEDDKSNDPKGYIPLENVNVSKSKKHKKGLELTPMKGELLKSVKYSRSGELVLGEHKVAELKAQSIEESWEWYEAITGIINKAN
ncbi:hypothetical protein TL16_g04636 [Triparma laevis f. inornata]|uniref:Uncharacterized protein n=2 Tax=Triparma laevis TaxID=1534972 RepID=A0A9W7FFN1_9STRA|nr:hypothetical protein TL16_g04636 [Triparma laevis f. inornata]GMI11409.1 hypothetical protein TrLO_g5163 [Triparma laevis f. longispina]